MSVCSPFKGRLGCSSPGVRRRTVAGAIANDVGIGGGRKEVYILRLCSLSFERENGRLAVDDLV